MYHNGLLSVGLALWTLSRPMLRIFLMLLYAFTGIALAEPLRVAVTVPPQAYFVERVGGERVEVQVMIPSAVSHEQYTPSPKQMSGLSRAKLYVTVGHPALGVEARVILPYLKAHPGTRVVNMSEGLTYRDLPAHAHDVADDAAPEEHAHASEALHADEEGSDPHVWVAPASVAIAVRNIAAALSVIDPSHAAEYEANAQRFLADIAALDAEITATLKPLRQRRFMVYHPVWGYFADQYGLEQIAIETGGKSPSPERLVKLIDLARREDIKVIFVQTGFATKSAEVIGRELGAQVMELDPLEKNWLANMRRVAMTFQRTMGDER